jgi:hypothetical protein
MKYVKQSELKQFREDNQPSECPIIEVENPSWVVDHDHYSGQIRGVISSEGNTYLGRLENAFNRMSFTARKVGLPKMLRNIADYLTKKDTDLLHPTGYRQLYKRFDRMSKGDQELLLASLGCDTDTLNNLTNSKERTSLYKTIIKND